MPLIIGIFGLIGIICAYISGHQMGKDEERAVIKTRGMPEIAGFLDYISKLYGNCIFEWWKEEGQLKFIKWAAKNKMEYKFIRNEEL